MRVSEGSETFPLYIIDYCMFVIYRLQEEGLSKFHRTLLNGSMYGHNLCISTLSFSWPQRK